MRITLNPVDDTGALVPSYDMASLVTGIQDGIQALGPLSSAVKKVDASFTHEMGLRITIHFLDPLGNEGYFATDYRFIGRKLPRPSPKEICELFEDKKELQFCMRKFLSNAKEKLKEAGEELELQLGEK